MEQTRPNAAARGEQQSPAPKTRTARKPYARPAITSEARLETRAGTPPGGNIVNPLNVTNDYGL